MAKPSGLSLLFLSTIVSLYIFLALLINSDIVTPTPSAYYNNLIDSFFHFRLDLNSAEKNDLSLYGNHWYMYWGAGPIFFILPFFITLGPTVSDKIYTLIAGILNVIIFYFVIKEFIKYFNINISRQLVDFILLNFAFASPNLYLSLGGRIWHTYQVIAIFYLLLFFFFLLKYLNNQQKTLFLILSVIFVNLAWFSRITLIFNLLFLIYPLILDIKNKRPLRKIFLIYALPIFIFVLLFFSYNFLRFANPLETGARYQIGNPRYITQIQKGELLSFSNFSHNLHHYFFNWIHFISWWPPTFNIDLEGNSVFSVYPLVFFILLYYLQIILREKQIVDTRFKYFLGIATIILVLSLTFLLLYLGTGWTQFGSRYFFDLIPVLYLIALVAIRTNPLPIQLAVVIYGIIINIIGTRLFYF